MSNKKDKKINEDLKRLEDQAYYELMQIIAEAMYTQDIRLLNDRISSWKTKYKKLLDRPSSDSKSDFKKKIEYLLNQYYSEVTQYILNQLKLNEEKKINNQAKAMRELYALIRDTNDLDLLNKKIALWKEKYPISGFLNMYKKRIELYTRQKNLKENAFNQEEAFSNLIEITKIHGTYDELKEKLILWEKKYSINDKYSIDDFIKHQSEVKRFTSDEFLMSIAREDDIQKSEQKTEELNKDVMFSDLSKQANAYTALLAISRSPNSVDKMFKWVYQNRNIKFNDKYKEMILSATYLDYSPSYLNKLKKPNLDMLKSSLSFEEYKNITEIKRYSIISYFNLLLPPDKAISNDFFDKNVRMVYEKSEKARISENPNDTSTSIEELNKSGIEISLKQSEISNINNMNSESISAENIYIKNEDDTINSESNSQETEIEIRDGSNNKTNLKRDDVPKTNEKNIDYITIETSAISETSDLTADDDLSDNIETDSSIDNEQYSPDLSKNILEITLPNEIEKKSDIDETEVERKTSVSSETKKIEEPHIILENDETVDEINKEDILNNTSSIDQTVNKNEHEEIIEEKQESSITYSNEENDSINNNDYSNNLNKNQIYKKGKENETQIQENSSEDLSHATIVALSPKFFEAVNYLNNQAVAVNIIDKSVSKHIKKENEKSVEIDSQIKNNNDAE